MKVLVVKLSDIGDVLTVTPALRALRDSLPEAHISLLVPPRSASLMAGSPLVDQLLTFDKFRFDDTRDALRPRQLAYAAGLGARLREEAFDALALMHHLTTWWGTMKYAALATSVNASLTVGLDNGRGFFLDRAVPDRGFGGRHEAEYWQEVASLLGAEVEPHPMEVFVGAEDEAEATALLPESDGPLVAFHPGGGGHSIGRRWPLSRFAEVARALVDERGTVPVIVGGPEEIELARQLVPEIGTSALNLVGRTSLLQTAAVIRRCGLFIGNDSGLAHLAAAVGTPVVAIFGPTNRRAWAPWSPQGNVAVVRVEVPCSPCLYVGKELGDTRCCQVMTCLLAVTPRMVLEAAQRLLR